MSDSALPWSEVRLRPLDLLDPQEVQAWQNDPEIRDRTMGFRFPVQKAGVMNWMEAASQQGGRHNAMFAVFSEETGVGVIMLRHIDWVSRGADLGVYIGAPGATGRGTGFVACALLLDYAFNGLGLHRVGLEVAAFNTGAIRLYERLGFRLEGTRRQGYYVSGRWEDVHLFGLLTDEFGGDLPASAHRLVLGPTVMIKT